MKFLQAWIWGLRSIFERLNKSWDLLGRQQRCISAMVFTCSTDDDHNCQIHGLLDDLSPCSWRLDRGSLRLAGPMYIGTYHRTENELMIASCKAFDLSQSHSTFLTDYPAIPYHRPNLRESIEHANLLFHRWNRVKDSTVSVVPTRLSQFSPVLFGISASFVAPFLFDAVAARSIRSLTELVQGIRLASACSHSPCTLHSLDPLTTSTSLESAYFHSHNAFRRNTTYRVNTSSTHDQHKQLHQLIDHHSPPSHISPESSQNVPLQHPTLPVPQRLETCLLPLRTRPTRRRPLEPRAVQTSPVDGDKSVRSLPIHRDSTPTPCDQRDRAEENPREGCGSEYRRR